MINMTTNNKNTFLKTIALFALTSLLGSCMMMHPMGMDHNQHKKDVFTDPVCGMQTDTSVALTFKYEAKIYYFDAEECLKVFQKNPQQFIKKENNNTHLSNAAVWGGATLMGVMMIAMMTILFTR